MPDLTSCWARFERGREHIRVFEGAVSEWARRGPYAFRHQVSPDLTRFSMVAEERVPPDLVRWALIVCEAFANLRCSLDHLVWAIGERQGVIAGLSEAHEREICFPVQHSPDKFRSASGRNLRRFSSAVLAAVESVQPYNRPHPELPPLLGLLSHIDNVNKHRLILPVCQVVGALNTKVSNITPPILAAEMLRIDYAIGEVRHGTEVLAIVTSKPQRTAVTFNAHIELGAALAIDKPPDTSVNFRNVSVLFNEIATEVKTVIDAVAASA